MKGTGAKRNVCPGSCVTTGAKFPVAPVESAPMYVKTVGLSSIAQHSVTIWQSLICYDALLASLL